MTWRVCGVNKRYDIFARKRKGERWECVATGLSEDYSKWEARNWGKAYRFVRRVPAGTSPEPDKLSQIDKMVGI